MRSVLIMLLSVALLVGCDEGSSGTTAADGAAPAPAPGAGAREPQLPEAMLAYEHQVEVHLSADRIAARGQALQAACTSQKFGACLVLGMSEEGGDFPEATLSMRAAPTAVEPLIAAAGEGGEIGSRSAQAEDLAVVVGDNTMLQDRLRKEYARLGEFQQRRDLAVSDMIALSRQMAETESQLEAAERKAAQYRRRIDTQLLTIHFLPPDAQTGRSEIGQAFRDFGGIMAGAVAWLIRALAVLLPLSVVALVLVLIVRRLRRR
jgi:hypothetical protein